MNDEAVYKTAPATPGLLNTYILLKSWKDFFLCQCGRPPPPTSCQFLLLKPSLSVNVDVLLLLSVNVDVLLLLLGHDLDLLCHNHSRFIVSRHLAGAICQF